MGFNSSFLTIFDTIHSWISMPLPLLSKIPIENESERGNNVRGGPYGEGQQPCPFIFHSSTFSPIFFLIKFNYLISIFCSHYHFCLIRLSHLHCLHSFLTFMNCEFNLTCTDFYTHLLVHICFRSNSN